ncbi:unnamed protein product [Vitrella brassicaformis CCMP3155]|uniref:Uncharacterized protein n=3 Tax=Vitrella brassicaformis TaxID=1169539 RepID=A0A0G4EDB1_VITBC|nr:unnamed protein product [Vitrella brassicaformis CCMP3155]|eukprot:CEL93342.1 unnamed protein product [Vitrella brassicaformis CCMP3155]
MWTESTRNSTAKSSGSEGKPQLIPPLPLEKIRTAHSTPLIACCFHRTKAWTSSNKRLTRQRCGPRSIFRDKDVNEASSSSGDSSAGMPSFRQSETLARTPRHEMPPLIPMENSSSSPHHICVCEECKMTTLGRRSHPAVNAAFLVRSTSSTIPSSRYLVTQPPHLSLSSDNLGSMLSEEPVLCGEEDAAAFDEGPPPADVPIMPLHRSVYSEQIPSPMMPVEPAKPAVSCQSSAAPCVASPTDASSLSVDEDEKRDPSTQRPRQRFHLRLTIPLMRPRDTRQQQQRESSQKPSPSLSVGSGLATAKVPFLAPPDRHSPFQTPRSPSKLMMHTSPIFRIVRVMKG